MSWLDNESKKEKANRNSQENNNKMFDKRYCSKFGCSNQTQGSSDKCPDCLREESKTGFW